MTTSICCLLVLLVLVQSTKRCQAFLGGVPVPLRNSKPRLPVQVIDKQLGEVLMLTCINSGMCLSMANDGRDDENDDDDNIDFLDRPFFDPTKVQDGSIFKWFADMVEQDYETAEALFASATIALLVVMSQELLRFYVHGDHYVPFKAGGSLW